jgi:hypothetical protein
MGFCLVTFSLEFFVGGAIVGGSTIGILSIFGFFLSL